MHESVNKNPDSHTPSALGRKSLSFVKQHKSENVKITLISYDEHSAEIKAVDSLKEVIPLLNQKKIHWINIEGLHGPKIFDDLSQIFKIHPLIIEDIQRSHQRPKFQEFQDYLFVMIKMLYPDPIQETIIDVEHVGIILGKNYVITLQEPLLDVFSDIRKYLQTENSKLRNSGTDFLFYSILDAIIDNYFVILERFNDRIEALENVLVDNPSKKILQSLQNCKRELIMLRKWIWPVRDIINKFDHSESLFIQKSTLVYIRDLYDHTIQVIDMLESMRDLTASMFDIYLSSVSNKLNDIMKVLTMISTIFIPLTLVAGVYGMNFQYMPEINWVWGYPFALMIMGTIAVGMLFYFRKKRWI